MKAKKYLLLIIMTVITGCVTQQRTHPQAQLFNHWSDVLSEANAWVQQLSRINDMFIADYQTTLDNESVFVATLTDQELESYEKYSMINDTDSAATVERRKRDLGKTLSPEKLTTAMELCGLKMDIQYGLNKIQVDKVNIRKRANIIERQMDKVQFSHRLTTSDWEEIVQLREQMDNYGTFVKDTVLAYDEHKE